MLAGRQLSALGRLSGAVMQGLGGAPLQHARGSASAAVKVLAAGADPAVRAFAFLSRRPPPTILQCCTVCHRACGCMGEGHCPPFDPGQAFLAQRPSASNALG